MTTYTDPFSSGAVRPSDLSYASLALTANVTLVWAADSSSASDTTFARIIDMSSDGGAYSVTFPDARRVSVGYDGFFNNSGGVSITLKDNGGSTIATVAAGEVRYVYLTDNSTAAGTWRSFNLGAMTSTTDAASLAGAGVAADGTTLVASRPTTTFSNNYSVVAADRAKNFVWTGGTGTLTLVALGSVDSDFFVSVVNQGTGVLTVDPNGAETIDGASTITLQPTESAFLMAGPTTEWYSLGRGRSTQFDFALLTKAITGGTTTLTPSEASNIAQVYTGTLISDADIVLPSVVQVYYVSNQTSGAFDVTFQTVGVGTDVVVPQGQNAILLCDGTNVINASTTAAGISSLSLAAGSVASPSLQFPDTSGFYQPSSSAVAAAIAGTQRLLVNASGITVTGAVTASNGMTVTGAAVTAATAPSTGNHLTNKTYVDAAIAAASGASTIPYTTKTANYTLVALDIGYVFDCTTNTFTLTFTAAATLGSGWWVFIVNSGTGSITLDPNGAETIDGLSTLIMYPGEMRLVQCTGSAFVSQVLKPFRFGTASSTSITMPPGYRGLYADLTGGGCGGASGGRDATTAIGGNGGPGGGRVIRQVDAPSAGTVITITVGAGGAGAAARSTDGVPVAGTNGSATTIEWSSTTQVYAGGGTRTAISTNKGGGASSDDSPNTTYGSGFTPGSVASYDSSNSAEWGGASGATPSGSNVAPTAAGGSSLFGGPGGGAGAGCNGAFLYAGSAGGVKGRRTSGGGGAAGATGGAGDGGTASNGGGGGGGNGIASSGHARAGNGGNGTGYGSGGGGGGASRGAIDSGAGGNGADGYADVWGVV